VANAFKNCFIVPTQLLTAGRGAYLWFPAQAYIYLQELNSNLVRACAGPAGKIGPFPNFLPFDPAD
jgi:hypothetical protein